MLVLYEMRKSVKLQNRNQIFVLKRMCVTVRKRFTAKFYSKFLLSGKNGEFSLRVKQLRNIITMHNKHQKDIK